MSDTELKSGSNLEKLLAKGEFVFTGELGPPKSADVELVKKKAEFLKGAVDAVNITDNQTAIVRMSSIAAGLIALQCGLEPVIQITCRDRNRLAMQADVLGAYALGLKNILCLSGDHQCFGNHPTAKNVYDIDSMQLISMLKQMRDDKKFACGDDIRQGKKGPVVEPKIFIGAAANPFGGPIAYRPIRLAKKVAAGADFIQTQCIYDMDRFKKWMQEVVKKGLHEKTAILAGITPLKSVRMAEYMRDNVAGMTVPDHLIERMKNAENPSEEGEKIAIEQVQEMKEIEGVKGVHFMAIEAEKTVKDFAKKAGLLPRPEV
ncbi:MAG: methylenetetrahydrofolate reductase [Fibrobacteria bacterium]|nr:methylenetetrahydrofolate reductase [Fibrobacteria bacterium]